MRARTGLVRRPLSNWEQAPGGAWNTVGLCLPGCRDGARLTDRKGAETVVNNISRARLVGTWFAGVAVVFACSVVAGAPMTIGAGELWLVGSLVPPAVMLLVWRGAPPVTVAELLYAVNRPNDAN